VELSDSIIELNKSLVFDCDSNPFISTPSYLLCANFEIIQNYMKIRVFRRNQLFEMLEENDFECSLLSSHPIANEILTDGTGFLTREDISEFDQACHEYLNGEFFNFPASGEELVAALARLREEREREMYLLVLKTF
jgi:hypothetical protein